ncbi:phosphatidylethanolamine binding [Branchiostoma belcheri]|nr:phosphatidylethanolamine binding [Branchiostoma belcheri]
MFLDKTLLFPLLAAISLASSAEEACTSPLGMASKTIRDDQITGSSTYCGGTGCWGPKLGRLHNDYAWYPRNYENPVRKQWFQVDLRERRRITGVQTQGHRYTYSYYVTSFKVQFSDDGTTWTTFATSGEDMVFEGNRGANVVKENVFVPAIQARFLRLVPWTWFKNGAALRLEILGCDVIDTTTSPSTTPPPQQTTTTTSDAQDGGQDDHGPLSTVVIIALAVGGVAVLAAVIVVGTVVRRRRSSLRSGTEPSSAARGGFVDNDLYMKASIQTGLGTSQAMTGNSSSMDGDSGLVENVIYETSAEQH